jgi:hypothetical protein
MMSVHYNVKKTLESTSQGFLKRLQNKSKECIEMTNLALN